MSQDYLTNTEEIWKPVIEWEELYRISNLGRVYSIKADKILKPGFNKKTGYFKVTLARKPRRRDFFIHQLVAPVFLGECPTGYFIDHVDGIKTNHQLSNLQYVTPSENLKRAFKLGLKSAKGEKNSQAKLTDVAAKMLYDEIDGLTPPRQPQFQRLADKYGISWWTVWSMCRHKNRRRKS